MEPERDDGISKASDNDMAAYSREVANGGNAATMLAAMAPAPVKAEDDSGAVALFMSDLTTKADTVLEEDDTAKSKAVSGHKESLNPEASGADFAAMFGQDIAQAQQEKDLAAKQGEAAAPSWFSNTAPGTKPANT